ncbi:MAG: winged helix-turn-helix transcriptional regulator [Armatimonadetes bacterium]|nr:winged helix-turn-helix transcriptional regulator [Armatimonadota bacterium]
MDTGTVDRMAALFGAMGNPTRVQIMTLLSAKPMSVNCVAQELAIGQPNASQHLAILERVGLLKVTKDGAKRIYELRGPRVRQILETLKEFCDIHGLKGMPEGEMGS